jgi:hypothetical protein
VEEGIKNCNYSVVEAVASCDVPNNAISVFGSFLIQLPTPVPKLDLLGVAGRCWDAK